MNTQSITLDVSKKPAIMPTLRIGQGDKNGTTIQATIYDNGSPLSLSGYSVRFEMRLPDGTSYYQSPNGTISGNVATIPIDETYAGAVDGVAKIAYIVVYNNSVVCSTSRINVIVLESAEEGADAAHAYSSGIIEATQAANDAAASATSAAGSATTAAANADAKAGLANTAATAANSAASTATAAASTASSNAAAAASAASQANSAATAANSAAEAANDATEDTEAATAAALAAIDAMGDISELAVPEMSANIRGGAKLGVGLDVSDGRLNVDLSGSGSGASVLTNGCALLDVEGDGWAEQDGTPTPENPQEVRVAKGRNLLQEPLLSSNTPTGQAITQIDGIYTKVLSSANEGIVFSTPKLPLKENTLYTCTFTVKSSVSRNYRIQVRKYDGNVDTSIISDIIKTVGNEWTRLTFTFRSPTTTLNAFVRLYHAAGSSTTLEIKEPQLEEGSTATPYVPYGHVGLEIEQGSTLIDCIPVPIPEEGLASVRDGTKDLLRIDSAGHVLTGKRVGKIVLDGSETWNWANGYTASITRYRVVAPDLISAAGVSSTVIANWIMTDRFKNVCDSNSANTSGTYFGEVGVSARITNSHEIWFCHNNEPVADWKTWLASNNVTLYYKLATPQTIDLGYIDLPIMPDGCTVSIPELHNIGVEWLVTGADGVPEMALDERGRTLHEIALASDAALSNVAPIENGNASTNYAVGSYLVHAGTLYRVTTAIATGETIMPGGNVTATTVMAEMIRLTA